MSRNVLADYLDEIARIRATRAGTGEISYYGALAGALNASGERLKPRVFCVPNLRNRGAGFPDMGLFAGGGLRAADEWPEGRPPERGVVEIDDIPADLSVKLRSAQVSRYLAAYGLVLVTNFRDFALLGRDVAGRPEVRERFSFGCADAAAFFALAVARDGRPAWRRGSRSFSNACFCIRHRSLARRMWRSSWHPTPATHWRGWTSRRACPPSPSCAKRCRRRWG